MNNRDVYQQVAQLHARCIDQGFLSSLGVPFLALLYESIDSNNSSVLLIAREDDQVVGFVSGAENMVAIYRQLLRRWPRLFVAMLPALKSPTKLWKIIEILLLSRKVKPFPDLPNAELLSIAVRHDCRMNGYAQKLYNQLVEHFRMRNVESFRIVVGTNLVAAQNFYLKMGAKPVGDILVHAGASSVMLAHKFELPK